MSKNGGAEKPAATLVCPECGEPMVATRSGSGAVLLKCKGCKLKGRLTKFGVAEVPVGVEAYKTAAQYAIFPGAAGERARAQDGAVEKSSKVTRCFSVTIDQVSVVDAAIDVYRQENQIEKKAKGWQAGAIEWICAVYLHGFFRADLDRYGVDEAVVQRAEKIRDLSKLRKSQLSLIPAEDEPADEVAVDPVVLAEAEPVAETEDDEAATDDGPGGPVGALTADAIEDPAERMNAVCEAAMRIAEDAGQVASDTLRQSVCSAGEVCGNALKTLEKAGHLRKKDQRPSLIKSAKGRLTWVYVPTGTAYLRARS